MKQFLAYITEVREFEVIVEATNEEEAENMVYNNLNNGMYDVDLDEASIVNTNVTVVKNND